MYNLIDIKNWLILVILFYCIISQPTFAQDRHTVLLYTFESIDGDVVKDLSGNGNDGKIMGAEWRNGKFRRGLDFGGEAQEDFVEIPDHASLDLVAAVTVEMWLFLRAESVSGGTGVTKGSTYKVGPRDNRKAELRVTRANGTAAVLSDVDLPISKWVHIAGTYDAETGVGKLYIDGKLDNEKDIGGEIAPNDNVVWLGRGANPYLDGILDDVRISNIERTQKEIQELMDLGIEKVLSVTPRDKLATTWANLKWRSMK